MNCTAGMMISVATTTMLISHMPRLSSIVGPVNRLAW